MNRISGQIVSFAVFLAVLGVAPSAGYAQDDVDTRAAARADAEAERLEPAVLASSSSSALPGLHRVAVAETTRSWAAIAFAGGFGGSGAIHEDNDSHSRLLGSVAVSWRPSSWLGISARVDQRIDLHDRPDLNDNPDDFTSTFDPRFVVRVVRPLGSKFTVGGELRLWIPAKAPTIGPALSSITPTAMAMATYAPLDALALTANIGARWDRSESSVADPDLLSPSDRMDLGLSEYNAVLVGLGARYRVGRAEVFGEWTWDALPGADDMRGTWPNRFAMGGRWRINDAVQVQLLVEATPSTRPELFMGAPLIPVEPRVQGMAMVTFQRGGRRDREAGRDPEAATIVGSVVNEAGEPIANAVVSMTIAGETTEATSGEDGRFESEALPRGTVELAVQADGYKESTESVDTSAGGVDTVEISMRPVPPNGQLRGVIQSFRGRPIKGTRIRVEPVGVDIVPKKGFFEVDLEPGTYTVIIRAPGYQTQKVKAVVKQNAVKILNVDMRKKRRKRKGRRR